MAFLWHGATVRRNHAIEHATVNVLEERYGHHALDGYATHEGFHIRGAVDPVLLLDAAREALLRLQRGDRTLAILTRCTTTLLCSFVAAWSGLTLALALANTLTALTLLLAALLAAVVAPTISHWLQRSIIISLDVKGMSIGGVELLQPEPLFGFKLVGVELAVRTKPARRVYHHPYRYGDPAYVPVEVRRNGK